MGLEVAKRGVRVWLGVVGTRRSGEREGGGQLGGSRRRGLGFGTYTETEHEGSERGRRWLNEASAGGFGVHGPAMVVYERAGVWLETARRGWVGCG